MRHKKETAYMETLSELHDQCHVNKNNNDGDRFVGIKADSGNAAVFFPIGYALPEAEQDLRQDILHLISVLAEFTDHDDGFLAMNQFDAPRPVIFPIIAYMGVINYFMEQNGYYMEEEPVYKTGGGGKADWAKTIRRQRPLIQSNSTPFYARLTMRSSSPNEKNLVTQINKFCVYESFAKLGWLFTPHLPEKPAIQRDDEMFLGVLRNKLSNTNNDRDKQLFSYMISMIEYMDGGTDGNQFYFGTERFEYVWEKLVDRVFGIQGKNEYFPTTRWLLRVGMEKTNPVLEPDTIMLYDGKIYVLDAKYYRFGFTGNPHDLPASSSISKQITYGEYAYTRRKKKEGYGVPVYNAFIMPYNASDNMFGSSDFYLNIGEATGDWKTSGFNYEKIQGIVVDTRYLMHHYIGKSNNQIIRMAQSIERGDG
ncbi:MAG: LlaJI family restriction endonuclease [bacterium]